MINGYTSINDAVGAVMGTPPRGKFQIRGVRFLDQTGGRGLLGDDMGLGKSWQSIAYSLINPQTLPLVVVCPATLKYNWQNEFRKHPRTPVEAHVIEGTKPYELPPCGVWIINYDILVPWLPTLINLSPNTVLLDECQRIKNRSAKRTKACKLLARTCPHVLALSGTPIFNGPVEFFPVLNMIAPHEFPSFTEFAFRFCNPRAGFRGHWDFSGASNLPELRERIAPFMLRRMKSEVLKDLPPTVPVQIPIKIPMAEYRRARDNFIQWIAETRGVGAASSAQRAETLVRIGELTRLAGQGKVEAELEWIDDFRHDHPTEKLVVFAIHKAVVQRIMERFPNACIVVGGMKARERQEMVDTFQTDPARWLFVGNLHAAGEGITLTAASTTVHTELWWNRAPHNQANDRVNRIGQTSKNITAYYFIAKGTIEEALMELQDDKADVVGQVVDGEAPKKLQDALITKLLTERDDDDGKDTQHKKRGGEPRVLHKAAEVVSTSRRRGEARS